MITSIRGEIISEWKCDRCRKVIEMPMFEFPSGWKRIFVGARSNPPLVHYCDSCSRAPLPSGAMALLMLIAFLIALQCRADSARRFPVSSEIETNWVAMPPAPLGHQPRMANVRSNVWELRGTNRLLRSSQKIGEITGDPTNFMAMNIHELPNPRKPILFTNRVVEYNPPKRWRPGP